MTLTKAIEAAREAIIQVLDDGGYINNDNEIYVAQDRHTGGCFCHAAALQAIDALAALPDKPMTEDELLLIVKKHVKGMANPETVRATIQALKSAGVLYVDEK